ncbi:MAG: hypothetical protein N2689_12810 [Verrucomicrobiae bacterium]|nr:hypothetical protein [Verrucomicrobiae bacterium]
MKKGLRPQILISLPVCLCIWLFSLGAPAAPAADQGLLLLKPGVTARGEQPQTWQLDLSALSADAAADAASKLSARLYGESEAKLHAPLVIKTRFDFAIPPASTSGNCPTTWRASRPCR